MPHRRFERRTLLLGVAAALAAPATGFAARQRLTLATGALPPLSSAPGHVGFLDALAREVFGRIGIDATVLPLPVERALVNANAGVEDGDMFRTPGFEKEYPNLVQIPEKVLDFEFVAYALRGDVRVSGWGDLAPYIVAYVTGWKIFERNVRVAREVTTVRGVEQLFPLLATGRADVVLLDRWQGLWLAHQAGLNIRPLDPPLARVPMFVYLHRRHVALVGPAAAALAQTRGDGTWLRLYDQILKPLEAAR
jgi:polar amino acid transport system substrate-binding protein